MLCLTANGQDRFKKTFMFWMWRNLDIHFVWVWFCRRIFTINFLPCVCAQSLQSCPTLHDVLHCSPPGSSVHGILQARILEWVAITNSRGSSKPRDWTWVSCIAGGFITNWATREDFVSQVNSIYNSRLLRKYWYNFDEFEIVNLGFVARICSPISILELN